MNTLNIEYLPISALKPYEKNARQHGEKDIAAIMASIEETGFNDPIGIWSDENIIVEGHGRLMAAERLGLETVPVIRLDHMTDEQRRAYAIFHNRTAEMSEWDHIIREAELADINDIDMSAFDFDFDGEINERTWFDREEKEGAARQDGNEEYNDFLDKFEPKKTTDDC